jgi:3-oxoacyl-[acyl-carrier-protein] synthase III
MVPAMKRVQVVSTGSYLPGEPITNDDMERLVGPLPEDILEGIQVKTRHWMIDPATGEHRINNSEMAFRAASESLNLAGLEAEQVDLLILATGTPDYPLPPVVNLVQDTLGLRRCATMELRSGGAGAVQALDVARMYLESGAYHTAVVIGSEAISPVLAPMFLGQDPTSIRMRDRLPLYMFGDGAGAMVLQASEDGEGGILAGTMACIGGGKKPGIQSIGGGTHAPIHEQLRRPRLVELRVDVVESGKFTPFMLTEALAETVRRSGVSADSIDHCLIPEGNVGWMLASLHEAGLETAEWVALEGKIFDNLVQTGATGCAAVPLFLDDAWKSGRIKPGDRVMLIGVEATKWIYAGVVVDWTAATPTLSGSLAAAGTS